jgi:glyoxylase-like metal-dependent hydrolase (beta-lactamase superfamily II)
VSIPYVREIAFEYGRCDEVSPLIRRVIADNPGPFTYVGTGTYIVGHGEVAVIDPGPDDAAHLEALMSAIAGERVSAILVTHDHADHSPLARPLQARTGAPIWGCARLAPDQDDTGLEAGADTAFRPDHDLCAGGMVQGPGWTLEVIPTPGHTSNHLCFALAEENALFSGDHVMGWSTTVIIPPDGDLGDYLASLETIRGRGFETLWPTHGPPIREVEPFLAAYAAHRQARAQQILAALADGPATIADLVPKLYADVDPRLHPAAAQSMRAAMIHLVREGRLVEDAGVYRLVL